MILIDKLCKSYGNQQIIKNLSLHIKKGKITGIAGPNACGKTTLIKSILGLVLPDSGGIRIKGLPVSSEEARQYIGYMPQNAGFPTHLTAQEYFTMLSKLRNIECPHLSKEKLIERFNLETHLNKPLGSLSAGTRQKVSAVGALMFRPEVLILDEPTAGFDPASCVEFKELIKEAASNGATVVIVSHIMLDLEQLINELIFMLDGKVIFSGNQSDLRSVTGLDNFESGIVKLLSSVTEDNDKHYNYEK